MMMAAFTEDIRQSLRSLNENQKTGDKSPVENQKTLIETIQLYSDAKQLSRNSNQSQ